MNELLDDILDDIIEFLTEERIKQFEKDKIEGVEIINISKEKLLRNIIKFIKELKNIK